MGSNLSMVRESPSPVAALSSPGKKVALNINGEEWEYGEDKMWSVSGENFFPCEKTVGKLPPGQYLINYNDQRGIFFTKKVINLDNLLLLPDSKGEKVLRSIGHFWKCEQKFRDHGFLWKRGIMLWGPPGSGKTVLVQQLSKQIVDEGGISVYLTDPSFAAEGLRVLRTIEAERPVVVMIEDIDAIIDRSRAESSMLALLDGELQIDNVVFVATTNYPERLDKRLVNRPSRFDEVIYVGMPSLDARKMYIASKAPRLAKDEKELNRWAHATDKLSIAHIREVVIAVECLGNPFDETLDRIIQMNDIKTLPNSDVTEDNQRAFGFIAD